MSGVKSNAPTVQGTNDSSIVSKHSSAQAGYIEDPFLSAFTLKRAPRRAPLINRGYYIRTKAIDTIIRSFLLNNGPKQIVSLGAGFDTTYFRLSSQTSDLMSNVFYMEVDFPEVVERKRNLINNSSLCSTLIGASVELNRPEIKISTHNYCLLGLDLADLNNLDLLWTTCTRLRKELPTLVLSECVMTYMEPKLSTDLIGFCQNYFTDSVFVTYEQVQPDDAFGQFMRAHFDKLNSSLKGISTFSNKEKQVERYKACGYSKVDVLSMKEFFDSLSSSEKGRISNLEYFDEYEEWHSKCFHYILVIARTHEFKYPDVERFADFVHQSTCSSRVSCTQLTASHKFEGVEQFAHSSCLLHICVDKWLLLSHGGFGASCGKHGRLSDLNLRWLNDKGEMMQEKTIPNVLDSRLHHTLTAVGDSTVFVFGGRLSPARPMSAPLILHITGNSADEVKIESAELNGVDCPDPRWRHAATHVVIDNSNCVLVTGGVTTREGSCTPIPLSSCHVYNVEQKTWSCLPHYPHPVHSQSMCYDGSRYVYSVGGLTSTETMLSDCYKLDTHQCSAGWQRVVLPLDCIYSHTLHVALNKMYIVGGVGQCEQQMGLQTVELSSLTQKTYALPVKVDDHLFMYFNHTSHVLCDGGKAVLLIVGGGGNCFSFGTHLNRNVVVFELC